MKKSKDKMGKTIVYDNDQLDLAKEFKAGQNISQKTEEEFDKDFLADDNYSLFDHIIDVIKEHKGLVIFGVLLLVAGIIAIIVASCNG